MNVSASSFLSTPFAAAHATSLSRYRSQSCSLSVVVHPERKRAATAPSRHEENGRGAVAPWRPLFMASHFWSHWVASPNDFAFMTQSYCDLVILPTHVSFTFCSVRLSVLTCAFTFST